MKKDNEFLGFTLAEMLVVMLILTIVMAAFAPLMTKRKTVDLTSPWRYAANNSDAYYGLSNTQTAMIGQNAKADSDPDTRFLIKKSDEGQSYITFKDNGGGIAANIAIDSLDAGGTIRMGGPYTSVSYDGYNTAFGIGALKSISIARANTAFGADALNKLSMGNTNTAIGAYALSDSGTDVRQNTALGYQSMSGASGSSNLALGLNSMLSSSGSNNIAIGTDALKNVGYSDNIAIGNTVSVGSSDNIIIGNDSTTGKWSGNISIGNNITSGGGNNIIITNDLGKNIQGLYKTFIGSELTSGDFETNDPFFLDGNLTRMIMLGDKGTKVIIPGDLMVMGNLWFHAQPTNASDKFEIARLSFNGGQNDKYGYPIATVRGKKTTCPDWYPKPYCKADMKWNDVKKWYDYESSDKRLKNIKKESDYGIDELKNIKVYNFTFKNDKNKEPHVGVIAQDLQKVFPESVKKDDNGYLMIRKDEMFYAMLNSIKQLDTLVHGIINEIKIVLEKITGLDNRVQQLEKENKLLKEQIEAMNKRLEKLEDD